MAKSLAWNRVDPSKKLVFIHIPRTAGTSFRWAAASFYGNGQIGLLHPGYYTADSLIQNQANFKLITGHFDLGNPVVNQITQPYNLLTVLRNPLHRFLSFFHYGVNKDSFIDHEIIKTKSLESVILDPKCQYHNDICYQLSGLDRNKFGYESAYAEASRKLSDEFTLFGLTENFPELVAIMYRRFGWNGVVLRQEEHVPGVPRPQDLDADLLTVLKKHNEADIRLYDFAVRLYESRRLSWLA